MALANPAPLRRFSQFHGIPRPLLVYQSKASAKTGQWHVVASVEPVTADGRLGIADDGYYTKALCNVLASTLAAPPTDRLSRVAPGNVCPGCLREAIGQGLVSITIHEK